MNETATAASFVAKWRERWPEWSVAEAFVEPGQRAVAEAWFALLQEFHEASWSGEDPTPGLAKLAWWHEELEGWAKGVRRHPLGQVLQRQPAHWSALARALNALRAARGVPAEEAAPGMANVAGAVAGGGVAQVGGQPEAAGTGGVPAVWQLAERALMAGDGPEVAWPLQDWPGRGGA